MDALSTSSSLLAFTSHTLIGHCCILLTLIYFLQQFLWCPARGSSCAYGPLSRRQSLSKPCSARGSTCWQGAFPPHNCWGIFGVHSLILHDFYLTLGWLLLWAGISFKPNLKIREAICLLDPNWSRRSLRVKCSFRVIGWYYEVFKVRSSLNIWTELK